MDIGGAMERETTIGKKLQAMDEKVRYDAACKRLLSANFACELH